MTNALCLVLSISIAGVLFADYAVPAEVSNAPSSAQPSVLVLTRANNGQHVNSYVGQTIQIDLQTLQMAGYGAPQISAPNIQFQNYVLPVSPNPGGPQPVYMFEATAAGEAHIRIPTSNPANAEFAVIIDVAPMNGQHALTAVDQSSTSDHTTAWTNLLNQARQTFMPSLPKLTKVEVELTLANPGPPDDRLTLHVFDPQGKPLVIAEKTVAASAAGWVSFVFADGGLDVTPGQTYAIQVQGDALFGWKYVVGGYSKGEALFNGKPLLSGARSSFLFCTYGAVEGAHLSEKLPVE
jgi:hypothetical protein